MLKGMLTWTPPNKDGRDLQEMGRILPTPDFPVNLTEYNLNPSFGVCPTDIAAIIQGVSEKKSNLSTVNQIVGRKMQIRTQRFFPVDSLMMNHTHGTRTRDTFALCNDDSREPAIRRSCPTLCSRPLHPLRNPRPAPTRDRDKTSAAGQTPGRDPRQALEPELGELTQPAPAEAEGRAAASASHWSRSRLCAHWRRRSAAALEESPHWRCVPRTDEWRLGLCQLPRAFATPTMDFLMSGIAACGACVFTNPLEVVKTRMQLQGELKAPGTYQRHYRNVFHAFFTIGKVDGLAALQKGLGPALLYQFLMNGIRLGTYGLAESRGYLHTNEGAHSPLRSAAAGALAGVMGAYLGSPIYMVKTHLQAQATSEIAVGYQYKHQGMFQALAEIGQKHGLVGLWRGAVGGLPRVVVGSSAQLCTFSSTKDFLSQWEIFPPQSWKVALAAAMVSGFAVVIAMTPFDVASTRLYNQPTDSHGKGLMYRGILDALLQTARTEGFFGMYKGIGASYFRLGPHTVLSLFFWDQLRFFYNTYTK